MHGLRRRQRLRRAEGEGNRRLMVAVASFCFYVPFMREIFLRFGMIDAAWPVLSCVPYSRVKVLLHTCVPRVWLFVAR